MEDEVIYTTVVFNRSDNKKLQKKVQTEQVEYSEIRPQAETSQCSASTCEEVTDSRFTPCKWTTACLGLTCVLLLGGVVAMSFISITEVSKNRTIMDLYSNVTLAYRNALKDKLRLEDENEKLTAQKDQFNITLQFIMQFTDFPVTKYCSFTEAETHCEPCMQDWIQNGSSCYWFHYGYNWKTWQTSKEFCIKMGGDLAVIESLEEQEFINLHTDPYYDQYHGYWIGLRRSQNWNWTTGTALNTGFWISSPENPDTNCALSKHSNVPAKSWKAVDCYMYNRWICEMKTISWPNGI